MTNTLTISVSGDDFKFLSENPAVSPTKLFREAVYLQRRLNSISDVEELENPIQLLSYITQLQNNILRLQKQLLIKTDAVESLKNVVELKQES